MMTRPGQVSLFDDQTFRLAELTRAIKHRMHRAAAAGRWSREEIVERMNHLAEQAEVNLTSGPAKTLSLATLEKWLNTGAVEHVPGLVGLAVFCQATGDLSPLAPLLTLLGGGLMTIEDLKLRDLGRAYLDGKKARQTLKNIEEQL